MTRTALNVATWASAMLFAGLLAILLLVSGCGSSRDTQTKTVETITTVTGPLVAHTPVGDIAVEPVRHQMQRSEEAVETRQTRIDLPDVTPIIQAASSGMSMGPLGIAGSLLGLVSTAAAGWTALRRGKAHDAALERAEDAERQRDEIIDGAERARAHLKDIAAGPDSDKTAWDVLKQSLEAEQSKDTKEVVRNRTA